MSPRTKQIAVAATAAALATGGMAVAQSDDSNSGSKNKSDGDKAEKRGHRGFGPGGPMRGIRQNLTYSEAHVKKGDGEVVYRQDVGKVKSASSDEIVITNNQGDDVTIPVNSKTKVMAGPGKTTTKVADLKEGRQVEVFRQEGKAATAIHVRPTKAEMEKLRKQFESSGQGRPPGGPHGFGRGPGGPPPGM